MQVPTNIGSREYRVDSALVAGEIMAKIRLIRRARVRLEGEEAGPVPPAPALPARDRAGRFRRRAERDPAADPCLPAVPA